MGIFDLRNKRRAEQGGRASTSPGSRDRSNTATTVTSPRSISLAFASGETVEAVCEHVIESIAAQLGASGGVMFFPDDELNALAVASISLPPDRATLLEGPVGSWMRSKAPTRLIERADQPIPLEAPAGEPFDIICLPVLLEDQILAALLVVRIEDGDHFDEAAVETCSVLADEIAPSVERIRMQSALSHERSRMRTAQQQLEAYAEDLRETFASERSRNAELSSALSSLEDAYLRTLTAMAAAIDSRDLHARGHIDRVLHYARAILKLVDPALVDDPSVTYGFLLHDIGNVAIPEAVLLKPGPLTDDEWRQVRRHPEVGRRILSEVPFLGKAAEIVGSHHERWDGRGYPDGLVKDEIPLAARAFAVADAYDAMRTGRPHRKPMSIEAAQMGLRTNSGTQFWSVAVEAFLSIPAEEIEALAGS